MKSGENGTSSRPHLSSVVLGILPTGSLMFHVHPLGCIDHDVIILN